MSLFLVIIDHRVAATFTTVEAAYEYAADLSLNTYEVQEIWVGVRS